LKLYTKLASQGRMSVLDYYNSMLLVTDSNCVTYIPVSYSLSQKEIPLILVLILSETLR
jgi:hypothetical protein